MNKIFRDSAWNLLSQVVPAFAALISIPLIIKTGGIEIFGVISLVWALVSFTGIMDFGISKVLTKEISENADNLGKLKVISCVGVFMITLIGILISLLIFCSQNLIINGIFFDSSFEKIELFNLILIVSITSFAVCLSNGLRGILEGYQMFRFVAFIRTPAAVWAFISPLLVLPFTDNLALLILPLAIVRSAICMIYLYKISQMGLISFKASNLDPVQLKSFFNYGAFIALSNLISPIMSTMDRFLVAQITGSNNIAYYSTPQDIVMKFLMIPTSIARALFPAMAKNDSLAKKNLDMLPWNILFLITLFFLSILILICYPAFSFFINVEFANEVSDVFQIFCVGMFFVSMAQIPFSSLQARGRARITAILHCFELPFFLFFLFKLTKLYGYEGAAIVWAARCCIDAFLMTLFDSIMIKNPKLFRIRFLSLIFGSVYLSFLLYIIA